MTMSIPEGYTTVTPWIISRDTGRLIAFVEAAFGAVEIARVADEEGATSVTNVTHLFWGDRVGRVRDPLGNLWWIQTRVEDVDEAEMTRRMSDPMWLDRMTYVQSSIAFSSGEEDTAPAAPGS
jgi:hypothetical protein